MSLYRAEKLIDLACSTTHEEEARTAALTACKLIRKHGLRLTASPGATPGRHAESAPRARPSPEPPREKPPNGGTWTKANRSGKCASCGGGIENGDDVYLAQDVIWCGRH